MPDKKINREELAALCHSQWSDWMKYLFSKCRLLSGGEMIIPQWAVKRWKKQAKTEYSKLSEKEMDSDKAEADKFIAFFEANK